MVLLQIYGVIRIGKISQFNPVSTIPFVGEQEVLLIYTFKKVGVMMAVNTLAGAKKQSVPIVILEKHVGEMDTHEMELVMNPETRTLKQITMDDMNLVNKTFMDLMGESVGPRKSFIELNAERANIDV